MPPHLLTNRSPSAILSARHLRRAPSVTSSINKALPTHQKPQQLTPAHKRPLPCSIPVCSTPQSRHLHHLVFLVFHLNPQSRKGASRNVQGLGPQSSSRKTGPSLLSPSFPQRSKRAYAIPKRVTVSLSPPGPQKGKKDRKKETMCILRFTSSLPKPPRPIHRALHAGMRQVASQLAS